MKSNYIPRPGDKITITDFSSFPGKVAAELARLPYLTVEDVNPITLSDENGENRYTAYEVYAVETPYLIGLDYKQYEP